MPRRNLTAAEQLESLRQTAVPGPVLLGAVAGALGAATAEEAQARRRVQAQRSAGKDAGEKFWTAGDWTGWARTKSEARALYKAWRGPVPAGLRFVCEE